MKKQHKYIIGAGIVLLVIAALYIYRKRYGYQTPPWGPNASNIPTQSTRMIKHWGGNKTEPSGGPLVDVNKMMGREMPP